MFPSSLLSTVVFLASTSSFVFGSPVTSSSTLEARTLRDDLTVDLGYGRYRGVYDDATGVVNFHGIRYGKSPTGDLRFAAPQAPEEVSDKPIQEADTQPNACIQTNFGEASSNPWTASSVAAPFTCRSENLDSREEGLPQSEDCLFLNIHVPHKFNQEGHNAFPVVMWFHGGGYSLGGAPIYDGSHLTTASNNKVITIVVQYRLGLFGFLAGEETKKNGQLNAGLLDQELAMKWVHKHIRAFGGDPHKMTIWGQSAGAGSVLHHAVSRNGKTTRAPDSTDPLYDAAIISSPYMPPQYKYNDEVPTALYNEIAKQAGCSGANSFSCLRSASTAALTDANNAVAKAGFRGVYTYVPVVDGEFLTQTIATGLKQGTTIGKALLTVTNANEGLIFVDPATTYSAGEYAMQLFPKLSSAQADSIQSAYSSFPDAFTQASAIMGESHFVCPGIWASESFANVKKKAFKAQFAIQPAVHLQDISYYFDGLVINPQIPPPFAADKFKSTFAQSFLSFVISMDPNSGTGSGNTLLPLPSWPTYTPGTPKEQLFGQKDATTGDIRAIDEDAKVRERCQLWASLADATAQ